VIAYLGYLDLTLGHPLAPFANQEHWKRSFEPLAGIPLGIYAALKSIVAIIPGVDVRLAHHLGPLKNAHHLVELAFLLIGAWLLWYGRRRLPFAYTALAAVSLAMTTSVPATGEPLRSLPRFTLVIFPLWISLALWASEKRRVRATLAVCVPLLGVWTYLFTAWLWAA
jgi:hypothetical protein